jgi:hypothetical protein
MRTKRLVNEILQNAKVEIARNSRRSAKKKLPKGKRKRRTSITKLSAIKERNGGHVETE